MSLERRGETSRYADYLAFRGHYRSAIVIRSRCIVFVEARIVVVVDYDAVDDNPKSPDHVTSSPSSTHHIK